MTKKKETPKLNKQERAKIKYNDMRAVGMSAKEARANRYKSPENVKAAIKDFKKQQRNTRAKENYKTLTQAGFSSKEANRYKTASPEKIKYALETRQLPPINPKKQTRSKIKTENKFFKTSTVKQITLPNFEEKSFQRAYDIMKAARSEGFTYYSIVIEQTNAYGQEVYFSTGPKSGTEMKMVNDLQSPEDLTEDTYAIMDIYGGKYGALSGEESQFTVSINLWRPGAYGK